MRYLLILLILTGCASKQPLTGGAKDETPPRVLSASPDSGSLNVTTHQFKFTFDEYIKTKNVNQLLVVSPSQDQAPTLQIKSKSLLLELNDSLEANTTYTLLFNGSIVDNNEENPLENYKYIFSTGNYIDSLNYRGIVTDITTGKPCEDCKVFLYNSLNDSNIILQKPDYITQSSGSGQFEFTNLPPREFYVYAIRDANKNLLLDDAEFVSMAQTHHSQISSYDTFSVFPYHRPGSLEVTRVKRSKPGIHQFAFNQYVSSDSLSVYIGDSAHPFEFNFTFDTIRIYNRIQDTSTLHIAYASDTFDFELIPSETKPYDIKFSVHPTLTGFYIYSEFWINSIDTLAFSLLQDSVVVPARIDSSNRHVIYLASRFNPNLPSKVILGDHAIVDVMGNGNSKDTVSLPAQMEGAPTLTLFVEIPDSTQYIVLLKKGDITVNQEIITSSKEYKFPRMAPGSYSVELIEDLNKNNNWDSGDPLLRRDPEPRVTSEVFEMRLNWDKNLTISNL